MRRSAVVTLAVLGLGASGARGQEPVESSGGADWTALEAGHVRGSLLGDALGQEIPGDSLYKLARNALNRREYEEAAEVFANLRQRFPQSAFTPDTYYYEAFARHRIGQQLSGERALAAQRAALELIEQQASRHESAGTLSDARALRGRIQAEMARLGDSRSRAQVVRGAQEACDRSEQELRAQALSALLNMDDRRARPILKEVLASRDECSAELRAQAVFILARHADEETVEILLDLAVREPDPDPEVRKQAVFWLSKVDRPEAVEGLLDLVEESRDPELLEQAIFALSQHDDPRATEVLSEYARRSDVPTQARGQAIFWLGQRGGTGAVGLLSQLYDDVREPELKRAVLYAMSQRDERGAQEFLLEVALDRAAPAEVRKDAIFWASQSGVDAPRLLDVLRTSDDPEVREAIILGISRQDSPEAVDALMDVARSDDDPHMREQAIFWLGQMDDPRIAEFLLEVIRR